MTMTARTARRIALTTSVALLALLLAACTASAQWNDSRSLSIAASWAYSGDDDGFRLELGQRDFVIDGGWFNTDNYRRRGHGDVIGLELGVGPSAFMSDYEGMPFVVGLGAYRYNPDDAEQQDADSFTWWLGAGDFEHAKKGLFYQYRYIFGGPIEGGQGILGWAF